ncbi:DEAD/DEAH box helicase family protein [bacterium]|nr:DEAD/DEAH box helicase family protein [bacterium]
MHPALAFAGTHGPGLAAWLLANADALGAAFARLVHPVTAALTDPAASLARIGATLVAQRDGRVEVIGLLHRHIARPDAVAAGVVDAGEALDRVEAGIGYLTFLSAAGLGLSALTQAHLAVQFASLTRRLDRLLAESRELKAILHADLRGGSPPASPSSRTPSTPPPTRPPRRASSTPPRTTSPRVRPSTGRSSGTGWRTPDAGAGAPRHARRPPARTARQGGTCHRVGGVPGGGEADRLYSLTVPTGDGKTLAALAFALKHAAANGLRRVIYVAPYTTILEQNADAIRAALGVDRFDPAVLEHHSLAEPPGDGNVAHTDPEAAARRAENWDAPVVVTTNV